jgi:hypothetical protein
VASLETPVVIVSGYSIDGEVQTAIVYHLNTRSTSLWFVRLQ